MNKVWITGRLTKEPELKQLKDNCVCSFDLAVNSPIVRDGKQQTDFINCIVWNKQAETLCKYQHKGNLIGIAGELRVDKYTKDNQTKTKTYVLVNNIEFLEKVDSINKVSAKTEFQEQIEITDEDLPW
jgi:single-strand DNA-binding protein